MYQNNTDAYVWAGLATYASFSVGVGLKDLSSATTLGLTIFGNDPESMFIIVASGNYAIYNDMAWQFLAYQQNGFAEIKKCKASIDPLMYRAWEKLDSGLKDGKVTDRDAVKEATEMMAQHEQEKVLQPILDLDKKFARQMTPALMLRKDLIPGVGFGNVGDFSSAKDRVSWVKEVTIPSFLEYY